MTTLHFGPQALIERWLFSANGVIELIFAFALVHLTLEYLQIRAESIAPVQRFLSLIYATLRYTLPNSSLLTEAVGWAAPSQCLLSSAKAYRTGAITIAANILHPRGSI